jgi:hypothetical protein
MCYSPESSFGTFSLVLIISIYLWNKGNKLQKTLAIILLFIALMQVLEGILWLNIDCSHVNKFVSSIIPLLLFLQPIVVIGTIYFLNTGFLSPTIYLGLLGIWLASSPLFINWMKDGFGKCTTIGKNGHLVWPFTNPPNNTHSLIQNIYNIILFLGFITLKTDWYGIFYTIMAVFGYYASKSMYGYSWGSIWCNFVNFLAVGALFVK